MGGFLNFKPRKLQREILADPARFKVPVVHRRFGKTHMAIADLVDTATTCEREAPRCYYLASTQKAAKAICWDMLTKITKDTDAKLSAYELSATWPENNAKVQLLSTFDFQKHRGIYADNVVFDETALMPPAAWTQVFRPALADRLGRASFLGTPAGRGFFHDLFRYGQDPELENWASWLYTVHDTDVIAPDEIADLKATMPARDFAQEFECSWDVGHPGAFYANEMDAMAEQGRICAVDYIPQLPVMASWFLPKTDGAVVTFWQQHDQELRCFDEIWEQHTTVSDVVDLVTRKPFKVEQHIAPTALVDVKHHASRIGQARALGLRFKPARPLKGIEGIYAAKPVLKAAKFDQERCADTLEALRQYHASYDEVARVYDHKPVVDWTNDHAGSVATFAAIFNPRRSDWSTPIVYPGKTHAA